MIDEFSTILMMLLLTFIQLLTIASVFREINRKTYFRLPLVLFK